MKIAEHIGSIRPDPSDPSPLRIDEALVRRMLVAFLREETKKSGHRRVVVAGSRGGGSAPGAAPPAGAVGPRDGTALSLPYRTSDASSREHARLVAKTFALALEEIDITPQVDAYLGRLGEIDRVRRGNKMARERKSIEYDRSWPDGLVLGTSNKTELLLGYGTRHGDMACDLNPVGDLYKTQLRELSMHLGVPEVVVQKAPSADLWAGQTDEGELGFTYAQADLILYHLVDRRLRPSELAAAGFDASLVNNIREKMRRS